MLKQLRIRAIGWKQLACSENDKNCDGNKNRKECPCIDDNINASLHAIDKYIKLLQDKLKTGNYLEEKLINTYKAKISYLLLKCDRVNAFDRNAIECEIVETENKIINMTE